MARLPQPVRKSYPYLKRLGLAACGLVFRVSGSVDAGAQYCIL